MKSSLSHNDSKLAIDYGIGIEPEICPRKWYCATQEAPSLDWEQSFSRHPVTVSSHEQARCHYTVPFPIYSSFHLIYLPHFRYLSQSQFPLTEFPPFNSISSFELGLPIISSISLTFLRDILFSILLLNFHFFPSISPHLHTHRSFSLKFLRSSITITSVEPSSWHLRFPPFRPSSVRFPHFLTFYALLL